VQTAAPTNAASTSSTDDMYKVTPQKPKDTRPDSAEKENGPKISSVRTRASSTTGRKDNILGDSNRRRDAPAAALTADANEAQEESTALVNRGRRPSRRSSRRRETSGLDLNLSDNEAFGLETTLDDTASVRGRSRSASASRSANTSTFSISQFKRRSRAPSIIGRDDGTGTIRPSSRGVNTPAMSSTFNIGQFRRRAREPSILSSNRRRQRENVTTDQSASENENEVVDDGEFAPDAESTPLNRRKTQPAPSASPEAGDEPELPSLKRTRKRKSDEAEQEVSNRPEKVARTEDAVEVEDDGDDEDSISDESLPSPVTTAPGPLPIPTMRPSTPVHQSDDGIMAPPMSSASEHSLAWPSIRALAKKRRRADNITPSRPICDNFSDVSSPPSLTHSPNFPSKRDDPKTRGRTTRRPPSPKLKTADLEALLAPRRQKTARGDAFDLSSDPVDTTRLGNDDDELQYLDTRRGRRTRSRPASRPGSRAGQPQAAAKSKSAQKKKRVSRTYGRRNEEEENEEGNSSFAPLPDDTFDTGSMEIQDPKQELRKAVKKFKEVDQWDLEFEDVTGEESQPDAR